MPVNMRIGRPEVTVQGGREGQTNFERSYQIYRVRIGGAYEGAIQGLIKKSFSEWILKGRSYIKIPRLEGAGPIHDHFARSKNGGSSRSFNLLSSWNCPFRNDL